MKKFYSEPPAEEGTRQTRVNSDVERERGHVVTADRDRPYLIVISGANVGEMFRLNASSIIGRAHDVDVKILDDDASRQHARLEQHESDVTIRDLGSSNGTLVNGRVVGRDPILLRDGDKITIGSTTILKFTYADSLDETFQRQMFDAAQRDGLTKLFNKRYFVERLATEVAYARRHHAPLSLLLFDVDHFKAVNDTYGHLAGDAVLAHLAKIAGATVRAEDVLARYGGEEFVVLSRGVPASGCAVLAERMRAHAEAASVENDGRVLRVTISIGVSELDPDDGADGAKLIARADEGLYAAKRGGRNRVALVMATRA